MEQPPHMTIAKNAHLRTPCLPKCRRRPSTPVLPGPSQDVQITAFSDESAGSFRPGTPCPSRPSEHVQMTAFGRVSSGARPPGAAIESRPLQNLSIAREERRAEGNNDRQRAEEKGARSRNKKAEQPRGKTSKSSHGGKRAILQC